MLWTCVSLRRSHKQFAVRRNADLLCINLWCFVPFRSVLAPCWFLWFYSFEIRYIGLVAASAIHCAQYSSCFGFITFFVRPTKTYFVFAGGDVVYACVVDVIWSQTQNKMDGLSQARATENLWERRTHVLPLIVSWSSLSGLCDKKIERRCSFFLLALALSLHSVWHTIQRSINSRSTEYFRA